MLNNEFNVRVRIEMQKRNIGTYEELIDKANLTTKLTQFRTFMKGIGKIKNDDLLKLSKFLEIPMDFLRKTLISETRFCIDTTKRVDKETKKKMLVENGLCSLREKQMRKRLYKAVIQYDKQSNFIKTWDNMTQASKELGIPLESISRCCHGKRGKAGGYIWKFKTPI